MNKKASKSLKQLCGCAMLSALAVIVIAICHFPIIPSLSFLEYDPGDIFIFLIGFMFGPVQGLISTIVVSLIQGFLFGGNGIIGAIMHIIPTGSFVLVSSLIYKKWHTLKGALIALLSALVVWVLVMIPVNILITPGFMGVDRSLVVEMLPLILLFNFIKAGINSIVTFLLYKRARWIFMKIFNETAESNNKKIDSQRDLGYNKITNTFISNSEEETFNFAEKFAANLNAGDVITLSGDLGAGKTVFAKGVAKGLGISQQVVSPTFTLANVYEEGRLKLNHFDMYRLESEEEAVAAGLEEMINSDAVSIIEWPERTKELIPEKNIEVFIKYLDENKREITIKDKR